MAWSLSSLRDKWYAWVIAKATVLAFSYLSAQQLGLKLGQALDDKFGKARTATVQQELATWRERGAKELKT